MISTSSTDELVRYHDLLGIAREIRHPSCYELLGLAPGEVDAEDIGRRYRAQMGKLQRIKTSRHRRRLEQLKAALRSARRTLSNPDRKRAYDQELRRSPEERLAARVRGLLEAGISTRTIDRLAASGPDVGLDPDEARALLRRWRAERAADDGEAPARPREPGDGALGWLGARSGEVDDVATLTAQLRSWLVAAARDPNRWVEAQLDRVGPSDSGALGWLADGAPEADSPPARRPGSGVKLVFGDVALDLDDELLGPEDEGPADPDEAEDDDASTVEGEPAVAFDGWTEVDPPASFVESFESSVETVSFRSPPWPPEAQAPPPPWASPQPRAIAPSEVNEDDAFALAYRELEAAIDAIRDAAEEHERLRAFVRDIGGRALVRLEHDGAFRDEVFDRELAACARALTRMNTVLSILGPVDDGAVCGKIEGVVEELERWRDGGRRLRAETQRVDLTVDQADEAWLAFLAEDRRALLAALEGAT